MANYSKGREEYPKWTSVELGRLRLLFPRTPWPELRAALPDRTRAAIWQMGKKVLGLRREINRRDDYTDSEIGLIRKLYPTAELSDLLKAIPNRTLIAIQRKASALGVRRPKEETRKNKRFVHPIFQQLRREREKLRMPRHTLARKSGYAEGQILAWELGKVRGPEFPALQAWAGALGFEVILKSKTAAQEVVIVPQRAPATAPESKQRTELEDRIAELEDAMGLTAAIPDRLLPSSYARQQGLHPMTLAVIGILLSRPFADRDGIYDALYGMRVDVDQPDIKIVDVRVHHARKWFRTIGVEMATSSGKGWFLDETNKTKLRAVIERLNSEQAEPT